ncbi:MAG: DHHA1 domain-containing protein [Desulfurococcaceae archaeon]
MSGWLIFTHGDGDGVASAALAKAFLDKKGFTTHVIFTHPVGLLGDLKGFLKEGFNVIILDIALNENYIEDISRILGEVSRRNEVIYIDHHPLLDKAEFGGNVVFLHVPSKSTSELTFNFFHEKGLDVEYSRVAIYGAISDYLDDTTWVKEMLDTWDKRSVYLEAGILVEGLEGAGKDYDFKRRVVEHLSMNKLPSSLNELVDKSLKQAIRNEELRIWVKNNVIIRDNVSYVINPPGSLGRAANYSRIYGNTKVGIAVETRGETLVMSLRSDRSIDLNKALREISRKLKVHGGGHPQAAGARMDKSMFALFLEELNNHVK